MLSAESSSIQAMQYRQDFKTGPLILRKLPPMTEFLQGRHEQVDPRHHKFRALGYRELGLAD